MQLGFCLCMDPAGTRHASQCPDPHLYYVPFCFLDGKWSLETATVVTFWKGEWCGSVSREGKVSEYYHQANWILCL